MKLEYPKDDPRKNINFGALIPDGSIIEYYNGDIKIPDPFDPENHPGTLMTPKYTVPILYNGQVYLTHKSFIKIKKE